MISAIRRQQALAAARPQRLGRVTRMVGLQLEVSGISAAIGDSVEVLVGRQPLEAEVVAVHDESLVCMPVGRLEGVRYGTPVRTSGRPFEIPVGPGLLGRVVDGLGRPIDGGPSLAGLPKVSISGEPPHPLRRSAVDRQLTLGVRALDTLVPCGVGQRVGIFSGSGVGKSSLLSMITRGTSADVTVIALIGERGREVGEFIRRDLGPEGLSNAVVVVATSDEPALVRIRAAFTATRIAESFRDRGRNVLLMMDSLTRFAMAQREVGLSAGEPPASRGYPPSVFAMLPRLLERAGAAESGSITGLYTVLVEGDDMNEPIADAVRSILDGHIVLTRRLATAGHFPSIDVLESVSRVENAITAPEDRKAAAQLRALLAALRDARDLLDIGAYSPGSNPLVDRALRLDDFIEAFLRQDLGHVAAAHDSWATLRALMATP